MLLVILIFYYISNGAQETHDSAFYQRTVAALDKTKDAASRQLVADDERQRAERVERLRKEHNVATATAEAKDAAAPAGAKQQPIGEERTVTGRKKAGDKVVKAKPGMGDDGVAKVGNVEGGGYGYASKEVDETEEEHEIELLLNNILKKGPIIVFSKSYCPHSMRAKVRLDRMCLEIPLLTLINSTSFKTCTTSHLHHTS